MTISVNVHANLPKSPLERQIARLTRLADRGVSRSTVMVHKDCLEALNLLRPLLLDPEKAAVLAALAREAAKHARPAEVGSVTKVSPFRYPGGKTWLVPEIRLWLSRLDRRPDVLVEPFAGGASIGLAVASEGLARRVILCERDPNVASVWSVVLGRRSQDVERLVAAIVAFDCTRANVEARLAADAGDMVEIAFRTILLNRVSRGGTMAPGAGLIREGEGGRGIASRWYPETLAMRIEAIHAMRDRIAFIHGDGLHVIAEHCNDPGAAFFVDPPYTTERKSAGRRLYDHHELSHPALFEAMSVVAGPLLATYDDVEAVRMLALRHGFVTSRIAMRTSHHRPRYELVIENNREA